MSEASGCRIEDYIKYSNNLCEGTDWKFLECGQRTQLAYTPMYNTTKVTEEQLDQRIKGA